MTLARVRCLVHRCIGALLISLPTTLFAQATATAAQALPRSGPVPRDTVREQAMRQQLRVADGFTATIFAAPPVAMYPVCLTATTEGAVFVCVDPNLSLTATKGRGRIVRLVDDNQDGVADRYTIFATMDSPRGLAYDGQTLYVMHPPTLTAYRDTTGDGIADVSDVLVNGLGFDLDFRGADHTTNGITLGIDGWLYIAVGDYGYRRAVGKDGTAITHRGGGVVRVRTDGTGLEMYAQGTRNIYDLAVDPFLNVFTRDNTNDGDGWDIRLHHLPAGANVGYPALYTHFANEHLPSLADYGAGSGTGGVWVHDPGFPDGFGNTLYTADWLLNEVFRHPLTTRGGSYDVAQEKFVTVPHPADMAMDGQSNMFIASLAGGSYTYEGDSVGYVVRVSPTRGSTPRAPNINSASDIALRGLLVHANSEYRARAQREILRRGERGGVVVGLTALARNARNPAYARVAAMFTLTQLIGPRAHGVLRVAATASDPLVRAMALRALTDNLHHTNGVASSLFVQALADTDPRVQMAAITSLVRLRARAAAPAIVPLTASADVAVAHTAVNGLVALGAADAALGALTTSAPGVRAGALRALHAMHDPAVIASLITRAGTEAPLDVIATLARLYHREAEWTGTWWGTRPSFIGPYFAPTPWSESARIAPVLRAAVRSTSSASAPTLITTLIRNRVLPQGADALVRAALASATMRGEIIDSLVGLSAVPTSLAPMLTQVSALSAAHRSGVAQLLAGENALVAGTLPLVSGYVADAAIDDETRAALIGKVASLPGRTGLDAATALLTLMTPAVTPAGTAAGPLEAAWRRFVGDRRRLTELDYFIDLSRSAVAEQRVLGFAVLLQSVRGARAPATITEKVQPVLAAAWPSYAAAADLARAARIMRVENAYAAQMAAMPPASPMRAPASAWEPLFNGKNLNNWEIKFTGQKLGVNFRNTFRVDSGMLRVRYDDWTDFSGQFGHLFYKKPFSYYIVAAEYRFVGNQVAGAGSGNSWAIRNNGIMVHAQSAASMGLNQDFPISLEVQMLGGLGTGTRTTGNLCTPGTHVVMHNQLVTAHCTNAASITYHGDQWVRVEAMVLGDSVIKHIVNGDTVLTYSKPQMGGGAANNTNPGVLVAGTLLREGFIALQAETAPIDFRKVEVLNLQGCMVQTDPNYRAHFVKSDPMACKKKP